MAKGLPPVGYKLVRGGGVPGGHNCLWNGETEPFVTPMKECASIELRHSDVVVDIGAYVGTYAIRCARFPVKRVVAYEPTPLTFRVLSLPKLRNMESVQAAVVGDDSPTVDLHISQGIGVTNSTRLSIRKAATVTVPAVSYGDAVRDASIVKIDVEGAEYFYGDLVRPNLRAIIVDFHPVPAHDWVSDAERLVDSFLTAGFTAVVEPRFDRSGWDRGGSWIRDLETTGECRELMLGDFCCGCGKPVRARSKALCLVCWDAWTPAHRRGFERAVVV